MAAKGRGSAEFATANERLESKVMRQLKLACSDAFTRVKLQLLGHQGKATLRLVRHVPPVYAGEPLLVPFVLDGDVQPASSLRLELSGVFEYTQEEYKIEVPFQHETNSELRLIRRACAQQQIAELEDEMRQTNHDRGHVRSLQELQRCITDIALEYVPLRSPYRLREMPHASSPSDP